MHTWQKIMRKSHFELAKILRFIVFFSFQMGLLWSPLRPPVLYRPEIFTCRVLHCAQHLVELKHVF